MSNLFLIKDRLKTEIALCFISMLFVCIYVQTIKFDFVWDDIATIKNNPYFEKSLLEGLIAVQSDHIDPNLREMPKISIVNVSYRPILYLSLKVDISLFGKNPFFMHIHNIILGLLNLFLFFFVSEYLSLSKEHSLISASIFALHPLSVETISYISARGDILATFFFLLSIICILQIINKKGISKKWQHFFVILGSLFYLVSILCKESGIGLPLIICTILLSETNICKYWFVMLYYSLVLVLYFIVRLFIIQGLAAGDVIPSLILLPGVWFKYLITTMLPFNLSICSEYNREYSVYGTITLLVLAILSIIIFFIEKRNGKPRINHVFLGLWWVLIGLAPALPTINISGIMADRYMYLPLAGISLSISGILHTLNMNFPRLRFLLYTISILVLFAWTYISFSEVRKWENNLTLYSNTVLKEPQSGKALYYLGYELTKRGDYKKAKKLYYQSIESDPNDAKVYNNIGVIYLNEKQYQKAIHVLQKGLFIDDLNFRSWLNLGLAHIAIGEIDQGCKEIKKSLSINPLYEKARREFNTKCD